MNASVPRTLCATLHMSTWPCSARLKMTAVIIQPMVSSIMAEARMIWPTLRRRKFISRITVATILTEAIESAVPRKSDVISRLPGSGSIESGSASPSATPQANGTMMPAIEAIADARAGPPHQLEIGFHAGQQQQHQHAELGNARRALPSALWRWGKWRAASRETARPAGKGRAPGRR